MNRRQMRVGRKIGAGALGAVLVLFASGAALNAGSASTSLSVSATVANTAPSAPPPWRSAPTIQWSSTRQRISTEPGR